jgi:energy-coupling factor transporter ATP-binding protein EcfA2
VGSQPVRGGVVLAVRDLRVRYPGAAIDALAGVSLDLRAGELVGLTGLNGAGKTTLCRCLNGIVPQLVTAEVHGSVTVGGHDALVTAVRRMAPLVGMVLDEPATQLSQATVGEEVALGMESLAVPYPEMVGRVEAILARLGIPGLADRAPLSLSGGEQQRVLLASVLAMDPPVLVIDEATSGLDPSGRTAVFDLLAELASAHGTAILVVEHDVELLAERADRLLVLAGGRLVADGTPAAVLGDMRAMESAGVQVPDVTEVAAGLDAGWHGPLPVTLADGLRLLAAGP